MGRILEWVSFTPLQNATGDPAISLPMGTTLEGTADRRTARRRRRATTAACSRSPTSSRKPSRSRGSRTEVTRRPSRRALLLGGLGLGAGGLAVAATGVEKGEIPGRPWVQQTLGLNGEPGRVPDVPPGTVVQGSVRLEGARGSAHRLLDRLPARRRQGAPGAGRAARPRQRPPDGDEPAPRPRPLPRGRRTRRAAAVRDRLGRRRHDVLAPTTRRRGRRRDGARRVRAAAGQARARRQPDRPARLVDGRVRRPATRRPAGTRRAVPAWQPRARRCGPTATTPRPPASATPRSTPSTPSSATRRSSPASRSASTAAPATRSTAPPRTYVAGFPHGHQPAAHYQPGAHNQAYWRRMAPAQLRFVARHLILTRPLRHTNWCL